jgi:hypothetical protein
VEDIYPIGGGVITDRDWVGDIMKGVCALEDKLGRLRKVRDLGGHGRLVDAPYIADVGREAVTEESMY